MGVMKYLVMWKNCGDLNLRVLIIVRMSTALLNYPIPKSRGRS